PYKKVLYDLHKQALASVRPKTNEVLPNLHHALLHNTIQYNFCVLKKHFPIRDTPLQYTLDILRKLILVLCFLYNLI
ncbi:hypothetical protein HOY80DRAFT_1085830, partial [Tuber brumale]